MDIQPYTKNIQPGAVVWFQVHLKSRTENNIIAKQSLTVLAGEEL